MNSMQNEAVDIILCCYNSEDTILKCVNSLLNQTHKNLRVLIFDDASNDKTVEKICSIHDDRIVLVRSQKNVGTYAGKNFLLKNVSSAKFIALQDADDYSHSDRISRQLREIGKNKFIVVGTSVFETGDKSSAHTVSVDAFISGERKNCYPQNITQEILAKIEENLSTELGYEKYLKTKICMNGTVMFAREDLISVGGWDGRTRIAGDTDIFCRLLMFDRDRSIYNMQDALYTRVFNKESLTASVDYGINSEIRRSYNMSLRNKILKNAWKSDMYFPDSKVDKIRCAEL